MFLNPQVRRADLAQLLTDIQTQEKQKLHLVSFRTNTDSRELQIQPSVVSSTGKDHMQSLEVAGSSDAWDETNITRCGFGHGEITDFGPTSWYSKNKINKIKNCKFKKPMKVCASS